jgi:hypothetical protein
MPWRRMGSRCIHAFFLDLGTSWRWVVSPRPDLFILGETVSVIHSDWSQSRSGRRGEVKVLDPTRIRNSDPSVVQPIASRYTDYVIPALTVCPAIYRFSQEVRSIFWEVIVSVILSKKCIRTCVLFRTVSEIQLFHCTVHCTLYRRATRLTVEFSKMYYTR